jgi:hypothetical protein
MVLHALGDAFAHSFLDERIYEAPDVYVPSPTYGQVVTYPYPLGHAFQGTTPDQISARPDLFADYAVNAMWGLNGGGAGGENAFYLFPMMDAAKQLSGNSDVSVWQMRSLAQKYGYDRSFNPSANEMFTPGTTVQRGGEDLRIPTISEVQKLIDKIKCGCQ